MTSLKPLQLNSNIAVQLEFELEIHKTFHIIFIRFCARYLRNVKMAHYGVFPRHSWQPRKWANNANRQATRSVFELNSTIEQIHWLSLIRATWTEPEIRLYVKTCKTENVLNDYLINSGNEFHMCAQSDLKLLFPNFIVFWEST